MIYMAIWLALGLLLGFVVPKPFFFGWPVVLLSPFCFGLLLMGYELLKGKARANATKGSLARELGIDPESPDGRAMLEAALMRVSVLEQFIYRFHLTAFIIGSLTIAVPMLLGAVIVYAIR